MGKDGRDWHFARPQSTQYLAGMSDQDDGDRNAGDRVMEAEAGRYGLRLSDSVRMYITREYGLIWWADACGEVPPESADPREVRDAMRRQLLFTVCALESWFFEWVRDDLLEDATESADLFASASWKLTEKIIDVLGTLYDRGRLAHQPAFGESVAWDDLHKILDHRNGLVHALASLPRGDIPPDAGEPIPTADDLLALAPARPLKVVRRVADLLTSFAGEKPPEWMEVPEAG